MKRVLFWIIAAVAAAAAVAGIWYGINRTVNKKPVYDIRSESVTVGDLMSCITASGTVEPEELVNVGAQVTGKIMNFGTDADGRTIDYGSKVTKDMLLAKIDDVLYDSELRVAKAAKLQAEVSIHSAEATLNQARAQAVLAASNWKRAQELIPRGAISRSEYDSCQAENLTRTADIAVAEAALEQARAKLASADASLVKAQRNLDYCFIKSPVDGVIIDRRVSVGQTLVSSMSASSIFLIAKDLRKMQVWVSVNEADIGSIKPGMPVIFTVDAFSDTTFRGTVHKIRLNATMSQNVVTYVVEVVTDNSDGKLLPYLTANVRFILDQRKQVLHVSNAALRFRPPAGLMAPGAEAEVEKFYAGRKPGEALLWKLDAGSGKVSPVRVSTGLNDGRMTEISGSGAAAGMTVVNGAVELSEEAIKARYEKQKGRSPFLPTPMQRRSRNPHRPAKK